MKNCLMSGYDTCDVAGKITGSIDDLESLYRLVAELKAVNRRLLSNMLLDENELIALIQQNKLQYEYLNGKYLNLWYHEWDYCRLFFYIADIDDYKTIDVSETVICDLFFSKYDEKNEVIICKLCEEHFVRYAQYRKWIRSDQTHGNPKSVSKLKITDGCAEGFYDLLKKCFDIYSDCVPEPALFEHYLRDKECCSAIEAKSGRLVGGIVISSRGDVQTEEYVFSDPDMRGKGIASELHCNWYARTDKSNIKYIAWIRDDNEASKRLHKKFNYAAQSSYKITMRR